MLDKVAKDGVGAGKESLSSETPLPRQDPEVPGSQKEIQGDATTIRREGRHRAVLSRAPGHAGPDQESAGPVGEPASEGGGGQGGRGTNPRTRSAGASLPAPERSPERRLGPSAGAGVSGLQRSAARARTCC